jgi:hypothetical protein
MNYDFVQGTSQAAPYVAGLAALIWAVDPTLTHDQVQGVIQSSADDLGPAGWDENYGYGRINAERALKTVSPPDAPTLAPINNEDGDGSYTVDWDDVARATSYILQESTDSAFASPSQYTVTGSQYSVSGQEAGRFFYRVMAQNDAGKSSWSNVRPVTVKPSAPILDPIDNPGNDDEYTLRWSASTVVIDYVLEEAANPSFTGATRRYEGSANEFDVTGQPAGTWYYRVRGRSFLGDSPWSQPAVTTVQASALPAPNLQPIDNPGGISDYTIEWQSVAGADTYLLEQSRDPYFVSPTEVYSGSGTSHFRDDQPGGTWHYRVRAFGPSGSSPWSGSEFTSVLVRAFLPFVSKGYSTLGPAPEIENGDFEAGPVDWTEFSKQGFPLITRTGLPSYFAPRSGEWVAWLAGSHDEISYIEQQVTVPGGKPYLSYWHWIDSDEFFCGVDVASVAVNGVAVQTYFLCEFADTAGWVNRSVNLGTYEGQSVSIRFRAETDESQLSNLFIDDIAFQDTPAQAQLSPGGAGIELQVTGKD